MLHKDKEFLFTRNEWTVFLNKLNFLKKMNIRFFKKFIIWLRTKVQSVFIIYDSYIYKVLLNNEYGSTAPGGNTRLGSWKLLFITLCTAQYITSFYVCFCLKTHLIYSWIINIEPMANSTMTHVWMKLIDYTFFFP